MFLKRLASAAALSIAAMFGAAPSHAAVIDLGFVLDGSGSVTTSQYNQARTALASALAQIPTSGDNQYRLAVTSYGSGQVTIIPPTIVTAANIASLQAVVSNAAKAGGGTDTAGAITWITNLFASTAGGLGATTLINITTDGVPNSQAAAENAALAAFNAGVDGISFEAVGTGVSSVSALANMARIAGLGTSGDATTGVVVNDLSAIPNATTTGFVIPVSSFEGYQAAIAAKIGQIVIDTGGGPTDPNVIPLPAGLPLLLVGLGALAVVRRRAAA
jgi:hypothetical protein